MNRRRYTATLGIPILRTLALGALFLFACTPVIPFIAAETAETLPKKGVSLTVAAGAGGIVTAPHQETGGADARVRVGIGHAMEVGLEAAAVGGVRDPVTIGLKLSYKYAPLRWLAIVAGLGCTGSAGVVQPLPDATIGMGADLGVIASTRLIARHLRIYGGPRFSFVVPLAHDVHGAGGPTQALALPVGLALELRRGWRLFGEVGYLGVWSENRGTQPVVTTNAWNAFFGAIAVGHVWR